MRALANDDNSGLSAESSGRPRLLLIPFHFPPIQGSTGASRSFEFARWLPEYGWNVSVLSVNTRAYPDTSDSTDHLLPSGTRIIRAFALDAARHLSIGGRYLRWTAMPDRWSSWIIGGVLRGIVHIWRERPDIIYTTYPTPSSHVIGLLLHKLTGLPWIAEFRDPMVEEGYPENGSERRMRMRLERAIFRSARRVVTVTPSARQYIEDRAGRGTEFAIEIANGYSDSMFNVAGSSKHTSPDDVSSPIVILHSGFLYEDVRSPKVLMTAIRDLAQEGLLNPSDVRFVFRGSGNVAGYQREAAELGIANLVEFRETVSYSQAYEELAGAGALLLMQGEKCNRQIPAKLYEYCALRKPILCLADPEGDTGRLFESLGLGKSVALEDCDAIKRQIGTFLEELRKGPRKVLSMTEVSSMSRRSRAKELADLLNAVHSEVAS